MARQNLPTKTLINSYFHIMQNSLAGLFVSLRRSMCVAFGCALSVSVMAEQANSEKKRPRHDKGKGGGSAHRGPGMGKDFKTLDVDGDGFLSFEEFSQSERLSRIEEPKRRKLFSYLDRNKDGKLDMSELRPSAPRWVSWLRKDFDRYDVDKSGGLDFEEFSKFPRVSEMEERERQRAFRRLDRNKDQVILRSDLKAMDGGRHHGPPNMDVKKFDEDQSGGLNFEEYSKMQWVSRIPKDRRKILFEKLDLNQDGEISSEEVKAAWAKRRKHGPPYRGKSRRGPHQQGKPPHEGDPGSGPPQPSGQCPPPSGLQL